MLVKEKSNTYNTQLLDLRNDYVFKAFFGDKRNKRLLLHFLNAVLDEKIHSIELTDPHLETNHYGDKVPIMDVRVETKSGEQVNIEMQMEGHRAFAERMHMYMAKMHVSQDQAGKKYVGYKKSIQIVITNFKLLKEIDYHNTYKITNQKSGSIFTTHYEMHILELPKVGKGMILERTQLEKWLLFLKGNQKVKEELAMESSAMKEAYEEIERLSQDPKTKRLAEFRERELKDIQQRELDAREEGMEQGIVRGIGKGIENEKRETIIKMYGRGFSMEEITVITGATQEKIEQIIESL